MSAKCVFNELWFIWSAFQLTVIEGPAVQMSRWWRKQTKIPSWEPTYPLEKQYWRWCSFPMCGICFLSLDGITWRVETWIEVHKLCHQKLAWKLNMSPSEEGTSWNYQFWGLYKYDIRFLWFSMIFWDAPLLVRGLTLKPTRHISCSEWRLTTCPPSWCPLPCRGTWRWKMGSGILNHMHIYIYMYHVCNGSCMYVSCMYCMYMLRCAFIS